MQTNNPDPNQFRVTFKANGRGKARCEPDPDFPHGIAVDISEGLPSCEVPLPYPAPECGYLIVSCSGCDRGNVAITAAGRVDDPISVRLPCGRKVD